MAGSGRGLLDGLAEPLPGGTAAQATAPALLALSPNLGQPCIVSAILPESSLSSLHRNSSK